MACELALFRSRTCYRCAFICSFSKFSGHRKSHASSNKTTLHAWLFLAYDLSHISLSLSLSLSLSTTLPPPPQVIVSFSGLKSFFLPQLHFNFCYDNYSAYVLLFHQSEPVNINIARLQISVYCGRDFSRPDERTRRTVTHRVGGRYGPGDHNIACTHR